MSEDNKAKSAIDIIYDLSEKIDKLSKQLEVIDTNVKLSNNKISKLNKSLASFRKDMEELERPNFSEEIIKSGKKGDLVIGKVKTFGRIVDPKLNPMPDVLVKVYNSDGDLIKTRKTDRDGYWDVRLPAGNYGLEYIHKGFKPVSTKFELNDNMESYEVK